MSGNIPPSPCERCRRDRTCNRDDGCEAWRLWRKAAWAKLRELFDLETDKEEEEADEHCAHRNHHGAV